MSDTNSKNRRIISFRLGDQNFALPLEAVREVAPYCALSRPPVCPPLIEGILNLAGDALLVLRLDRLLLLPEMVPNAGSRLLIIEHAGGRFALLTDEVREIHQLSAEQFSPVPGSSSFNACVETQAQTEAGVIHLLSLERLLLSREREALGQFMLMERRRRELLSLQGMQ